MRIDLDEADATALEIVRADTSSDAEALRAALHEAAARRRDRAKVLDEVRRLAADPADREEMRLIREQLAEFAPRTGD